MYNIRQLTNHDLNSSPEMTKVNVLIGGDKGEYKDVVFKQITSEKLGSDNVIKFGFCMNSNPGIGFPIYINGTDDNINRFYLGKTGMLEWQPEDWQDVNVDEEIRTAVYPIHTFYIPIGTTDETYKDFDFVLDYCYQV